MDPRVALKKLADRKEREIDALRLQLAQLQLQLAQAEAYLQAVQDSIRVLPREQEERLDANVLREGTAIAQARDVLKAAGRPLHILEILKRMGRAPDKQGRVSLSGSLAAYVRRNQVFRKAGPNTFTLIGDSSTSASDKIQEERNIPEDFGKLRFESETLSSFSPLETEIASAAPEGQRRLIAAEELDVVRDAVAQALVSSGHASAGQLLSSATWSMDGDRYRIEVAGVGRKMLALTVNAATEKIIRQTLAQVGAPARFSVIPSRTFLPADASRP